jgi:hypothetical protein
VNDLVRGDALTANRPAYVHDVSQVRTLAPVPKPGNILNAAVTFFSHVSESGTP